MKMSKAFHPGHEQSTETLHVVAMTSAFGTDGTVRIAFKEDTSMVDAPTLRVQMTRDEAIALRDDLTRRITYLDRVL